MVDDAELLRCYVRNRSEEAFAELVRRHVDLVYSVARRQVGGDAHLAEDVVQVVFTALARKAAILVDRPVLGGWLYRTAQFAAIDVVRAERRRRIREVEAHSMNELTVNPDPGNDWEKLRPALDRVIGELNDRDRDAVVLRFFEGKSFADVGTRLRLTENAARMRVARALEKMHGLLARRGMTSTTAALGLALANQASLAAPTGLAAAVTGGALSEAAAGSGVLVAILTMSKIKVGIVSALILAGAVTAIVELRANRELRADLKTIHGTEDELRLAQKENRQLATALDKLGENNPEIGELTRLRQRAAVLNARPEGVVESQMKWAALWQDRGRATPESTWESFCYAVYRDDLDAVASFIVFRDDTKETREAFMAKFSEVVRSRYRTPERLCAAAFFNAGAQLARATDDAFQLIDVQELGPDRVRVNTWIRRKGEEFAGHESYTRTAEGWAIALPQLLRESTIEVALARIDPLTGNVLVNRK